MKLKVKALSPIFIDSGKTYIPMQFRQSDDCFEVYKMDDVLKTVNDIQYFNASMLEKALIGTVSHSRDKSFYNLNELIGPHVDEDQLNQCPSIKILNKTNATNLKKEIKETIKTLDKPFIPGSTLKGLIRNAILFDIVFNMNAEELDSFLEPISHNFNRYFNIEDYLLAGKKTKGRNPRVDAKNDPYKFMQVTDMIFKHFTTMVSYVKEYPHEGRDNFQFVETISPESEEATFEININDLYKKYPQILKNPHAKVFLKYFDINKIFDAIQKFTYCTLFEDLDYLERVDGPNKDQLKLFINEMMEINTTSHPVIRLGMYSGHIVHSILLAVKNDKDRNEDKYNVFLKYFKNDFKTSFYKNDKKYYKPVKSLFTQARISSDVYDFPEAFPTTRKYIQYDDVCQLFGFAQVFKLNDQET